MNEDDLIYTTQSTERMKERRAPRPQVGFLGVELHRFGMLAVGKIDKRSQMKVILSLF